MIDTLNQLREALVESGAILEAARAEQDKLRENLRQRDALETQAADTIDELRRSVAQRDTMLEEERAEGEQALRDAGALMRRTQELDAELSRLRAVHGRLHIVFDGPPGPEGPRFIECENDAGASVGGVGEWCERDNGWWELVLPGYAVAGTAPQEDAK